MKKIAFLKLCQFTSPYAVNKVPSVTSTKIESPITQSQTHTNTQHNTNQYVTSTEMTGIYQFVIKSQPGNEHFI